MLDEQTRDEVVSAIIAALFNTGDQWYKLGRARLLIKVDSLRVC